MVAEEVQSNHKIKKRSPAFLLTLFYMELTVHVIVSICFSNLITFTTGETEIPSKSEAECIGGRNPYN